MSVAIETATRLHEQQIKATARSQDVVLSVIKEVAFAVESLRAKSPSVPGVVARPMERVTASVTRLVGTHSEVASYVARSAHDWAELQQQFRAAVLELLVSHDEAPSLVEVSETD